MWPLNVRLSRMHRRLDRRRKSASPSASEASSAASSALCAASRKKSPARDALREVAEGRVGEVPRALDGGAALLQRERVGLLQVDDPLVLWLGRDDADLLAVRTVDCDASQLHWWTLLGCQLIRRCRAGRASYGLPRGPPKHTIRTVSNGRALSTRSALMRPGGVELAHRKRPVRGVQHHSDRLVGQGLLEPELRGAGARRGERSGRMTAPRPPKRRGTEHDTMEPWGVRPTAPVPSLGPSHVGVGSAVDDDVRAGDPCCLVSAVDGLAPPRNWLTFRSSPTPATLSRPIAAIAEDGGSVTQRILSRAFRRAYGRSPRDVRSVH